MPATSLRAGCARSVISKRTRVAGLPADVVVERQLLEARALAGLGRTSHALELVSGDDSLQASRLRADIAWDQDKWSLAGRRLEALMGDRWRSPDALQPYEAHDILRGAIAYALADDERSVERLAGRYASLMAQSQFSQAFSLVITDISSARDTRLTDLVEQMGSVGNVDSFMAGFTGRFDSDAAPS